MVAKKGLPAMSCLKRHTFRAIPGEIGEWSCVIKSKGLPYIELSCCSSKNNNNNNKNVLTVNSRYCCHDHSR